MTQVRNHWWWRPGWGPGTRYFTFHFTFGTQPGVQRLAASVRSRLRRFPALDPVPGPWLHLTTQGIAYPGEVSAGELDAVTDAARRRLAPLPAVPVTVRPPRASSEGVASYITPDGALDRARNALRAAIAEVLGGGRVPEGQQWRPHVSFAYANADADGDPYDAALDGLGPVGVTLGIVELILIGRDNRVYEWDTIAELPLAGNG